MNIQKLTLHHYGATEAEDRRVTLSPMNVMMIAAEIEDFQLNGRSLRRVSVCMADGESTELVLNHADLDLIENAIGSFCLGD